jgi:hypothetical protein
VDSGFNPGANGSVNLIAVQADGQVLVGGDFTLLGGQPLNYLGRLNNTAPATQSLSCDGSTITWLRGGTGPEVWRTTFEVSTNDIDWTSLGSGARISGGWRLTGVVAPPNATIRARGFATGGYDNGSSWWVESVLRIAAPTPPRILVSDGNFGFRSNQFGFNLAGEPGSTVVIETSTNLVNWSALTTNTMGAGTLNFSDPNSRNFPAGFYRARVR